MPKTHRLTPGKHINLEELSADGKDFCGHRRRAEEEFQALRQELVEIQPRLYAEGKQSLLIVFQAMDAGGKDGCTRRVFTGVNPQGVYVASFKAPNTLERSHDFLWRIHQQVPPKGMIGVFNRSHYEDVLIVRVENLAPKEVWKERYEMINQFERMLTAEGVRIIKFYLHISKTEQKERFQDRLDDPSKHWKFSPADLEKREDWEEYQEAYEAVLNRCTTPWAPWYVIPSDRKWYRNLAVTRVIVDTLKEMDPQFPAADWKASDYVVE